MNRLSKLLVPAVGDLAIASVQNPVMLPPHSEPQPDFAPLFRMGGCVSPEALPQVSIALSEVFQ
ncbi:MAG: hypothetical protein EXR36_05865 [Betaproteobacteria bacterium]|nr:hypothetical protein [Betaproteobacteria bacterium]